MEKKYEIEMNKRFSQIKKNCIVLNEEIQSIEEIEAESVLGVILNYLINANKEKVNDETFNKLVKYLNKKYKNNGFDNSDEVKYEATYGVLHSVYAYALKIFKYESDEFKKNIEMLFRTYCSKVPEPKSFKKWPKDDEYGDDENNKTK